MRIPKKYGSYKVERCPFCDKQSTTSNSQGVPVCIKHKDSKLIDLKCQCGGWLDILNGKYGPFFNCFKCGNISFSRGLEINENKIKKPVEENKKETIITSDKLDAYFS